MSPSAKKSDSPSDKKSDPPADEAAAGTPDLRRTVGEATERIHEIIDAAEQVALDIRREAEAEAGKYLEERRREVDRAVEERRREADRDAEERSKAFDALTRSVADTAEEFKHQAERLLAELDRVIVDARAGVYRQSVEAALEEEEESSKDEPHAEELPEEEPLDEEPSEEEPLLSLASEPFSVEALSGEGKPAGLDDSLELPPLEPASERPEPAAVTAYGGRSEGSWGEESGPAGEDRTSEALLRATQLAVTGKERDEIADVLRADYPGVDTEPLLDEILG